MGLTRLLSLLIVLTFAVSTAHAQREAEGLSASIRKATARVAPAVVSIRPVGIVPPVAMPPFGGLGRPLFPRTRVERLPSGSGVVIDAKRGLVATSGQVLRGAMQAEVILPDGSVRPALRVMAADPATDLVLIEIESKRTPLAAIEWADSRTLPLGEWVVAVGRSASGKTIASAGIISAAVEQAEAGSELEPIQTDALVTPESAGGPLVNLDGQVVGISQARGDFVGGDPRDGFRTAIPEALVRKLAEEFRGEGKQRRGYLGVTLGSGRRPEGTVVTSVAPGSPAAMAGLAPGDRIVSIDGRAVRDAHALSRAVEMVPIGQEMTLVVERQGKKFEAKFRTEPRPDVFGPAVVEPEITTPERLEEVEPQTTPAPPEPDKPKSELPPAILEGPKSRPKTRTP
jgi:serine protease Do